MKTITITTAQKVNIDFELATLLDRILAFVIDMVIYFILLGILVALLQAFVSYDSDNSDYYFFLVLFPIYTLYTFYWEYFNKGRTPGKMALGLRIIRENGEMPTITNYLTRWVFRMIDIWFSSGFIAAMFVASTDHAQRLGEVVSGTVTIKVRPKYNFNLADILKIGEDKSYVPKYKQVAALAEDDMLLIKQCIERNTTFSSKVTKESMLLMGKKMKEVLGIEEKIPEGEVKAFLETLIKDYIILTR